MMSQGVNQPKVTPGPNEPNWWDILQNLYSLDMHKDLANPVESSPESSRGVFSKRDSGPVIFEPVIALGTEQKTHGGWYSRDAASTAPDKRELWSYLFKNPADEIETGKVTKPPLAPGSSVVFDPGRERFGLWISNENFEDGGVFSEPSLVRRHNARLAGQPYKAMIYPLKDQPGSYLIGWEYSTNDDFQDVVCILRNAVLQ